MVDRSVSVDLFQPCGFIVAQGSIGEGFDLFKILDGRNLRLA